MPKPCQIVQVLPLYVLNRPGHPDLILEIELTESVIRGLCEIEAEPDGLIFQSDSVHGERIKDDEEYEGVRLRLVALHSEWVFALDLV